ncbi:hypothetical protein [Nocardia nova]|uniref:hypothetical protein n=1 Tax=Nocardia nova TaxID=37330 RepID=UPI0033CA64EE
MNVAVVGCAKGSTPPALRARIAQLGSRIGVTYRPAVAAETRTVFSSRTDFAIYWAI